MEKSTNPRRVVPRLVFVSAMLLTLAVALVSSSSTRGAHVDEHWWKIIPHADEYVEALLTHDIDVGEVPYPEALDDLQDAGFTITTTTSLGYSLTIENNRVWPFGTESGGPTDPEYWRTVNFRKAIHRLIPKDECVALFAPLRSKAEWWLPPGSAYWINRDCPLPTFDPIAAVEYLDAGGFAKGTMPNPNYDPSLPWSSPYMRIDPLTGEDLTFQYIALGPTGMISDPIGWGMAKLISSILRKAGIGVHLAPYTWKWIQTLLIYEPWGYQFMTFSFSFIWNFAGPDILYDFTYHQDFPPDNFAQMNISEINEAGERMMTTLDLAECRQAAFDIQTYLSQYEPYYPMMLLNMFTVETGAYDIQPGAIGIVNFEGRGAAASGNVWGKMLGRADRYDPLSPDVEINKWGLRQGLDTLNPLTADTAPDWQVLNTVEDYLFKQNPYTLEYMWWAAEDAPTIEAWIGPGNAHSWFEGNEVYDAPYNGTHYNGIPVADITAHDLAGDDQLGMVTTWTLRPGIYWHDSDPGPDMTFDTPDDGIKHPVTAEDVRFCLDLLKYQDNVRYFATWYFIHGVEVLNPYAFKIYEERRYLFAFEDHNAAALLTPKHIWEPWINPTINVDALTLTRPDGSTGYANVWADDWTSWDNHHDFWFGWEEPYMPCPIHPGEMLTYLIGCGPFHYHLGGWDPGVSVHVESNGAYFGRSVCPGDVDLDQKVEEDDLHTIMASFGEYGAPNFDVKADICYPAQIVTLDEVYAVQYEYFGCWWGPGPVPPGWTEYTG